MTKSDLLVVKGLYKWLFIIILYHSAQIVHIIRSDIIDRKKGKL